MAKAPNTFEIEPKEQERFFSSKVREVIKKVLEDKLSDSSFDPDSIHMLCEDCTKEIRSRCRTGSLLFTSDVRMPRYKLEVQVVIGELKGQGIRVASKCLWDPMLDDWASYSFSNVDLTLLRNMDSMLWAWFLDATMNDK